MGELIIGEGLPKICVPLVGTTPEMLISELKEASHLPCHLVEWRADYYLNENLLAPRLEDEVLAILNELRRIIEVPIIFTIRTKREGGDVVLPYAAYSSLIKTVATRGEADFVDIQIFSREGSNDTAEEDSIDQDAITKLIHTCHQAGKKVILSSHDMDKTPDQGEMLARLIAMVDLGADIPKLAVMANSQEDARILMETASIMAATYDQNPFIALAMGKEGMVTRICGGQFGSAITFAAGRRSSAPGQLSAELLSEYINKYYEKESEAVDG